MNNNGANSSQKQRKRKHEWNGMNSSINLLSFLFSLFFLFNENIGNYRSLQLFYIEYYFVVLYRVAIKPQIKFPAKRDIYLM